MKYKDAKVAHPQINTIQQSGGLFHIFVTVPYYDIPLYDITVKQEDIQRTIDILNKVYGDISRGIKGKHGKIIMVFFEKEEKSERGG